MFTKRVEVPNDEEYPQVVYAPLEVMPAVNDVPALTSKKLCEAGAVALPLVSLPQHVALLVVVRPHV